MGVVEAGRSLGGSSTSRRLEPTSWGKYRIIANLGQGGMADVCLAEARSGVGARKLVVVKRIRTELVDDPRIVAMFHDEARLAVRLNHPNVVHTYEVEQRDDGVIFIVMEYLEGQPLSAIFKKAQEFGKPFPERMVLHIVSDALSGLHYAHELRDYDGGPLRIVHRDISPHNLFVTYAGQTKVMDFGIAKAMPNAAKTEAGEVKGKLMYMAPEQANGQVTDHRADIFSMGIVLWELLTGRRLINGDSTAAVMHQLLLAPIPRASTVATELRASLDDIIARALERAPEERFQSAKEMRDALESYLAVHGELVRAEEIEAFVVEVFRDVRQSDESMIQAQMAELQRGTSAPPDAVTLTQAKPVSADDASLPSSAISKTRGADAMSRRRIMGITPWHLWSFVSGAALLIALAILGLASRGSHRAAALPATTRAEAPIASLAASSTVAAPPPLEPEHATASAPGAPIATGALATGAPRRTKPAPVTPSLRALTPPPGTSASAEPRPPAPAPSATHTRPIDTAFPSE